MNRDNFLLTVDKIYFRLSTINYRLFNLGFVLLMQ
jgi:hypothetical protein